jgi:hypothetical protein
MIFTNHMLYYNLLLRDLDHRNQNIKVHMQGYHSSSFKDDLDIDAHII